MPRHLILSILSILFIIAAGCKEHDLEDTFKTSREINKVEVDVDSADVIIKTSSDGKSKVDVDMTYHGRKPDYTLSTSGNVLKVRIPCPFMCDGRVTIRVPETVNVMGSVDSGNIEVYDITGSAELEADSGSIKVDNLVGDLELCVDSGNINGEIESTRCYADADSGNIKLRFNRIPEEIEVSADSGNVKLWVPEETYDVSTKVDSGHTDIDNLVIDDGASNTIRVDVDSGNIDIIGF